MTVFSGAVYYDKSAAMVQYFWCYELSYVTVFSGAVARDRATLSQSVLLP